MPLFFILYTERPWVLNSDIDRMLPVVPTHYRTCWYRYFWFKHVLGQKYHTPQVWPNQGSNSWPPYHDRTVHVTEMPALTTRSSVTSPAKTCYPQMPACLYPSLQPMNAWYAPHFVSFKNCPFARQRECSCHSILALKQWRNSNAWCRMQEVPDKRYWSECPQTQPSKQSSTGPVLRSTGSVLQSTGPVLNCLLGSHVQ